jgi:hypothetical protein
MVLVPKKKNVNEKSSIKKDTDSIELPTDYNGLLFFYLDGGTGSFYSVYNHPYHIIREFLKGDTTYDYENSCQDAVTWLYHQINGSPLFPKTNACLEQVLEDKASLDDISLTYLAEVAKTLPGTLVGYAKDVDQLSSILGPVVTNIPEICENIFRDSGSRDAVKTIVNTTDFANGTA